MRDVLQSLVVLLDGLRIEIAGLREEIAASRRRQTTRERTVRENRRVAVQTIKPSELDVERAKRMLRRSR